MVSCMRTQVQAGSCVRGIGTIRNVGRGQEQGPPPTHVCPAGRPLMWLQSFCPQSCHFLVCICGLEVDRRQRDGARWCDGCHCTVFIVAWMGLFPTSESVPPLGQQFPEETGGMCSFSASTEKTHSKFSEGI